MSTKSMAIKAETETETKDEYDYNENQKGMRSLYKLLLLLGVFLAIILILFVVTVWVAKHKKQWRSFLWFINGEQKFSFKVFILSMIAAMVFGFVDNSGLWFGMDALEYYIPGGPLTQAGWSNGFSNVMGKIIEVILAKLIYVLFMVKHGPMYAEVLGVAIECILGIYIPRAITGRD